MSLHSTNTHRHGISVFAILINSKAISKISVDVIATDRYTPSSSTIYFPNCPIKIKLRNFDVLNPLIFLINERLFIG